MGEGEKFHVVKGKSVHAGPEHVGKHLIPFGSRSQHPSSLQLGQQ